MRLLAVVILSISVFTVKAQGVKYISFKQTKVAYTPQGFYISDVKDDRPDKDVIGVINKDVGAPDKIAFKDGFAEALKAFSGTNVPHNKSTQPIVLHIVSIDLSIKKHDPSYDVEAGITLAFYAGDKKLIEYSGNSRGTINSDPCVYMEKFIRQALETDFKKFDGWWAQNKGKTATNSAVKVNVTIGKTIDKPNCFVYSLSRPLQIIDFTGAPEREGNELATTLSGIALTYTGETENGQLVINITIMPYFDKSRSWFKVEGKNPRILAHEQAHFDITAIYACKLVNTLHNTTFTPQNYDQLIDQLQRQNAQQSMDEENLYDNETNHGIITDKQEEWQNKINAQVKAIGCY